MPWYAKALAVACALGLSALAVSMAVSIAAFDPDAFNLAATLLFGGLAGLVSTAGYWLFLFCPRRAHPWSSVCRFLGVVAVSPMALVYLLLALGSAGTWMLVYAIGFVATMYLCWEALRRESTALA